MIHPIEFRYGRPEMKALWEEQARLQLLLKVESALANAHAKVGNIPKADAAAISRAAKKVTLRQVQAFERETRHEMMAVVKALSEQAGRAGANVHLGATSSDILDTALALQLKDSVSLLENDLQLLKRELLRLAGQNKSLVCVGRTHGKAAAPTTYGLRFAIWAAEVQRHIDRLSALRPRLLVGKMTGATGTQAAFGPKAASIQKEVMAELGLQPVDVSNQVIQRDRHAEYLQWCALAGQSLNKFALSLRLWQRSEIGEVAEDFDDRKQVGSSTMPQKRNPVSLEQICGLSRILLGNSIAGLENVPLWEERDLTNSAPERIIILESSILLDHMLAKMIEVLRALHLDKARIKANLEANREILAERLMIALVSRGVPRQQAHEMLRRFSMAGGRFDAAGLAAFTPPLSSAELCRLLDPSTYIGTADRQVEALIKKLDKKQGGKK